MIKITNTAARIFILWLFMALVLRLWEFFSYGYKYTFNADLCYGEAWGFINDVSIISVLLLCFMIINLVFKRLNINVLHKINLLLLSVLSVIHLAFIHYFNYQQSLLDIFVYRYPLKEIKHTIATTEAQYGTVVVGLLGVFLLILLFHWLLKKVNFGVSVKKILRFYLLLSLPFFVCLQYYCDWDVFSRNKSYYFYTRSLAYFFEIGVENKPYTANDAKEIQDFLGNKNYISDEYPLLHTFDTKDSLSNYFPPNEAPQNVVVLIMEGLNDDYIHDYKGHQFMPFLNNLASKSLYWERCFTLGERSFAAVPCLTGSLPYGTYGFNFLPKLPNHLSLTSVLEANGYFTSFFDGQGSWFHNKDRFFKHNNINLIFDNTKYDEKYKKIIVKDFFWGYNDKDLFQQSLEVMDTLPKQKRLNMYFTGTMHSPFSIADEAIYEQKWQKIIENCRSETDKQFFKDNVTYFKSILFTNDALEDYFKKYQQKADYNNTLFIITGDHPMTELPRKNSLKRYHVPMIIFSPKLKKAKVFADRVSHLDIYETILAYLDAQKTIKAPNVSSTLGGNLFYGNEQTRPFVFMNDNREIIDFLYGDYYLADNKLYQVDADLNLTASNDKTQKQLMESKISVFKKTNFHVSTKDKIISDSLALTQLGYSPKGNLGDENGHFDGEFHNIFTKIPVNQNKKVINLHFKHDYLAKEDSQVVVEIADAAGKIVVWKSEKIKANTNFTQLHFKIPAIKNTNTALQMNAYFWNTPKQNIQYEKLNCKWYE